VLAINLFGGAPLLGSTLIHCAFVCSGNHSRRHSAVDLFDVAFFFSFGFYRPIELGDREQKHSRRK
jgi:hypothetical protein